MRWQKKARLVLAVFIVVFAGFVALALRRTPPPPAPAESLPIDSEALVQTLGTAEYKSFDHDGKLRLSITSTGQRVYENGRNVFEHATVLLPDRNGRTITITADEAEATRPADGSSELSTAVLRKNVKLSTSDDLHVTTENATYNDHDGILNIPGPVSWTRGRMTGHGVGATYDRNRDVLWLLADARIDVAADPGSGGGAVHATAGTAGLARADHYIKLSKSAHLVADERTIDTDDLTIALTPDDQKVRTMELRGNSRIVGTGANAQQMAARDIDLTYADDGRALQAARLMEQSMLDLPGDGSGRRQITARNIDLALAPDGSTVTQLAARESVVLTLPAEGQTPARRIAASALTAAGAGDAGIEAANFDGPVQFTETASGRGRGQGGTTRTATANRLMVRTEPGLGAIKEADFHGHVKFVDGTDTTAEAPRAVYRIADDRLELFSSTQDPGPAPTVSDGRITVFAKSITLGMTNKALTAETDVRSRLEHKPGGADSKKGEASRTPSLLAGDQPVTVTSNRLTYDGAASRGTFSGSARLTQEATEIRGDTIALDDQSGNLTANGSVTTRMALQDTDPKTGQQKAVPTVGSGETFAYDDAKRVAVYTSSATAQAHIQGAFGDVTGDRIELYLKTAARELERAEADGHVTTIESNRTAKGKHLTYTASDETYVMTGSPVDVLQRETSSCKRTLASTLRFRRAVDNIETTGNPVTTTTVPCPATAG